MLLQAFLAAPILVVVFCSSVFRVIESQDIYRIRSCRRGAVPLRPHRLVDHALVVVAPANGVSVFMYESLCLFLHIPHLGVALRKQDVAVGPCELRCAPPVQLETPSSAFGEIRHTPCSIVDVNRLGELAAPWYNPRPILMWDFSAVPGPRSRGFPCQCSRILCNVVRLPVRCSSLSHQAPW